MKCGFSQIMVSVDTNRQNTERISLLAENCCSVMKTYPVEFFVVVAVVFFNVQLFCCFSYSCTQNQIHPANIHTIPFIPGNYSTLQACKHGYKQCRFQTLKGKNILQLFNEQGNVFKRFVRL